MAPFPAGECVRCARVASRIQTFCHVQCNAFVELFCREDLESEHDINVCVRFNCEPWAKYMWW